MAATTVKLEEPLLKEIRALKPREQTLSAYVREALERDVRRQKLAIAAREYAAFLAANPGERDDMQRWAEAPLTKPVPRRKR
jgi:hypothetical protein